ncbi:MAG UNVERIFIED_CONTAM: cupredoxin domain-containing protein [Rickettsiaceae bacterium]|jgi:hypothetical protein
MFYCFRILVVLISILSSFVVYAEDDVHTVEIKIENHVFLPSEIHAPKDKKIKLVIENLDNTIEEFDSPDLKREKILRSKAKTNIILAPLREGKYYFVGEFNPDTAQGVLIVE